MQTPSFWSRIAQWATPFRLENPNMTLDELSQRINDLDRPKNSFFSGSTLVASASRAVVDDSGYLFSMARSRELRYGWYTSAELSGVMTRDPDSDSTVATGVVQMSGDAVRRALSFAGLTVFGLLIPMLPGVDNPLVLLFPLITALVTVYFIGQGAADRSELLAILHNIMNTQMPDRSKRKNVLEETEETTHLVDLHTNEPVEESQQHRAAG